MQLDNRFQSQRESLRYGDNPIVCEDHPSEIITNFCFASLRALCPACIDYHNKMMKQKNMFPEIATMKSVKTNCTKKCSNAILALQAELGNLDNQMITNPKTLVEEGVFQLRRARDKLISFINKYIESLEIEYERSVTEAISKATGFSDIGDKVHNLIQELEHLMYDIETPKCISAVQRICRIDFQALLDKFRHDISHTLNVRETLAANYSEIVFHDSLFPEVTETIERYIHLGNRSADQHGKGHGHGHDHGRDTRHEGGSPYQNKSPGHASVNDDSGFLHFHKDYHNDLNQEFEVTLPDYFDSSSLRKYLHFFQNHENRFHYVDLTELGKQNKPAFEAINLNIDFKIPPFHKSIVVPNGDIYLVGGSDADDPSRKLSTTYLFDWNNYALVPKASLAIPRSSFAICYMNKSIYVAGGLTNNSNFTKKCERYDIATNRWTPIAELNYDVLAPCMTAFNNKFIFKFGGYKGDYLEPYVEKYDPAKNTWHVCHVRIELTSGIKPDYFKILSTSACVQINPKEIYVFGGYLEDNTSSNQTFVFRVNKEDDDTSSQNYAITKIGVKTLTHPEAFWNNTPIVFNRHVYALQNVPTAEHEDVCLDDKRRLISFDSTDWFSIV